MVGQSSHVARRVSIRPARPRNDNIGLLQPTMNMEHALCVILCSSGSWG